MSDENTRIADHTKNKENDLDKLTKVIRNFQAFVTVAAVLIGTFMAYLTSTFVSNKDFNIYKEDQLNRAYSYNERNYELLGQTIEKALTPLLNDNLKISSDITSLRAEVSVIKGDVAKLNFIIENGRFTPSDTFNRFRSDTLVETQQIKSKISEIESNIQRIERDISTLLRFNHPSNSSTQF